MKPTHVAFLVAVVACLAGMFVAFVVDHDGQRAQAADANLYKPTASVSTDWQLNRTTGALLVDVDRHTDPNFVAAATAAKNRDYVVYDVTRATFEPNTLRLRDPNCSTMSAWPSNLVGIGGYPEDANLGPVRFRLSGAVDPNFPMLPAAGVLFMPVSASDGNTMQFRCDNVTRWTVIRFVPRN